ncbi:hypothetical protein Ccrd_018324 [Cynara cardunculus var. scolymus]|uniref:Uncharacterized protein n=1 Tax=Cynara cardunculus var. scolymus TaxID=59895 RepID=A0A103Y6F2_CYNCS|nr:hypothetical protein Ccrd_018324 [Cynara cardunculus var. scolymus]
MYFSANWTLFTFSCSLTSIFPYSRSLLIVIFGCSKVGGPSREFTSLFPMFSTPIPVIHFHTPSNIVSSENTSTNTNSVFASRRPVELLHTTVTNKRGIQSRKVVTRDNNRHSRVLLFIVHARKLNVGWVISNVHKRSVNHLVVHSVLSRSIHPTSTCIEIVDEQHTHFPLTDYICCLAVHQRSRFLVLRHSS